MTCILKKNDACTVTSHHPCDIQRNKHSSINCTAWHHSWHELVILLLCLSHQDYHHTVIVWYTKSDTERGANQSYSCIKMIIIQNWKNTKWLKPPLAWKDPVSTVPNHERATYLPQPGRKRALHKWWQCQTFLCMPGNALVWAWFVDSCPACVESHSVCSCLRLRNLFSGSVLYYFLIQFVICWFELNGYIVGKLTTVEKHWQSKTKLFTCHYNFTKQKLNLWLIVISKHAQVYDTITMEMTRTCMR